MVDVHAMVSLTGGSDFWHTPGVVEADLPELMWTDGPHGVRGPSPRIVDTVVVDYAAVGSVVARWAS